MKGRAHSAMADTPADSQILKRAAAAKALDFVTDGMKLGLGTGSTAEAFLEVLAPRVRGGLAITGVATSDRTADRARSLGITLAELDAGADSIWRSTAPTRPTPAQSHQGRRRRASEREDRGRGGEEDDRDRRRIQTGAEARQIPVAGGSVRIWPRYHRARASPKPPRSCAATITPTLAHEGQRAVPHRQRQFIYDCAFRRHRQSRKACSARCP